MKACTKDKLRGSYTVEAAIIFSFIIILLITLIFASLLICEKVILNKIAAASASQAAAIINDTKLLSLSDDYSLYQRIKSSTNFIEYNIDIGRELEECLIEAQRLKSSNSISDKKNGIIRFEVNDRLRSCILRPDTTLIRIEHKESLFKESITVRIKQDIVFPLGFIKDWFDGKPAITLEAEYTALAVEPSEYIRNMDLVIEYSKKIAEGINISELLKKLKINN